MPRRKTKEQIAAWKTTKETRWIAMADGSMAQVTMPTDVWYAYDYLIDRGHQTHTCLLDHANMSGWEIPNLPFAERFAAVIAKRTYEFRWKCADWV